MGKKEKNINTSLIKIEHLSDGFIKLDFNTTLEDLLNGIALFSGIISITLLICIISNRINAGKLVPFFSVFFFIFITGLILRYYTHNYYIIDSLQKQLLYHFQFLFIEINFMRGYLSDIIAVSVDFRKRSSKQRSWNEYSIVFLTGYGKKLRMSNWEEINLSHINSQASEIAGMLDIKFIPGKSQSSVDLCRNNNGTYEVIFRSYNYKDWLIKILIIIVIVFLFPFIIAFILHLNKSW